MANYLSFVVGYSKFGWNRPNTLLTFEGMADFSLNSQMMVSPLLKPRVGNTPSPLKGWSVTFIRTTLMEVVDYPLKRCNGDQSLKRWLT